MSASISTLIHGKLHENLGGEMLASTRMKIGDAVPKRV